MEITYRQWENWKFNNTKVAGNSPQITMETWLDGAEIAEGNVKSSTRHLLSLCLWDDPPLCCNCVSRFATYEAYVIYYFQVALPTSVLGCHISYDIPTKVHHMIIYLWLFPHNCCEDWTTQFVGKGLLRFRAGRRGSVVYTTRGRHESSQLNYNTRYTKLYMVWCKALYVTIYRWTIPRTSSVSHAYNCNQSSSSLSLSLGYNPPHKYLTSCGARHLTLHLRMGSSSCWVQHEHHFSVNLDPARVLLTWALQLPNFCGFSCQIFSHQFSPILTL